MSRYDVPVQYPNTKPGLTPSQVQRVRGDLTVAPTAEADYPELTASQDDFPLGAADFHKFTLDANHSITGFGGQRSGLQVILNADTASDLTLEHEDAASEEANRIHSHTGADIVLGPDESVLIRYDRTLLRWRTVGFT